MLTMASLNLTTIRQPAFEKGKLRRNYYLAPQKKTDQQLYFKYKKLGYIYQPTSLINR